MPKRISFQLYTARKFPPWEDVVAMLAKAGIVEVEGFGANYEDPKAFRTLLDSQGLAMTSGHFSLDMLEKEPAKAASIARTLGIYDIYCPYIMPDQRPKSAAGWKAFGKRLGKINVWARGEGFGFGWHNHDFEFRKLADGSMPHERIFEAAPNIDWECDVGWVAFAGQNPLKWMKAYKDRITALHVKDLAPKGQNQDQMGQSDVGAGTIKWADVFKLAANSRVKHYVLEHDDPKNVASFARNSAAFCKKN